MSLHCKYLMLFALWPSNVNLMIVLTWITFGLKRQFLLWTYLKQDYFIHKQTFHYLNNVAHISSIMVRLKSKRLYVNGTFSSFLKQCWFFCIPKLRENTSNFYSTSLLPFLDHLKLSETLDKMPVYNTKRLILWRPWKLQIMVPAPRFPILLVFYRHPAAPACTRGNRGEGKCV